MFESPASPRCFIIACVGRQGSSYLQGLLNSHPDAQCLGEVFAPGGMYAGSGQSPAEFLAAVVHAPTPPVPVSGFKFGYMHMELHPEVHHVLHSKRYYCLHLTRENMLDQYISMTLAQLNNMWASTAGIYKQHSFTADPDHMIRFFDLFERHDRAVVNFIEGLPTLEVVYERLVGPDSYLSVLDFLGLPACSLSSPYQRQRRGSQRDAIDNYDEIKSFFRGTDRALHFLE